MFTELFNTLENEITQRSKDFTNEELIEVHKTVSNHKYKMSSLETEIRKSLIENETLLMKSLLKNIYEIDDIKVMYLENYPQAPQNKEN